MRFHNNLQPCQTASFPLLHTLFSTAARERPLLCTSLSLNQIASISVLTHRHSSSTSGNSTSTLHSAGCRLPWTQIFFSPPNNFRKNIQTWGEMQHGTPKQTFPGRWPYPTWTLLFVRSSIISRLIFLFFFQFLSVRSDPGPRVRARGLQVRVSAGLRVPVRGSDHVLWRSARGGRIPEHCQRRPQPVRYVQVSAGWGRLGPARGDHLGWVDGAVLAVIPPVESVGRFGKEWPSEKNCNESRTVFNGSWGRRLRHETKVHCLMASGTTLGRVRNKLEIANQTLFDITRPLWNLLQLSIDTFSFIPTIFNSYEKLKRYWLDSIQRWNLGVNAR